MSEIPFNLNQSVRVKLTELGVKVLADRHAQTNAHLSRISARALLPPFVHRVDAEGYTSFQLWSLMQIFGPHMGLGMPNVCDLDIILEPNS